MKSKRIYFALPLAVILIAIAAAAAKVQALKPGEEAPDFALKDQTGKEHKLSEHKGVVVVLEFSSPNCPFSRGVDPSISKLAEQYKDKGVIFLGIDSNNGVSVEDIKKHVEEAKVTFPVLKDEGNLQADAYGAKQTPEIFVIDKEGKIAYHGAYDNRTSPEKEGNTNYVAKAVDALLAGKEVEEKEVKAWGCGIKRVS